MKMGSSICFLFFVSFSVLVYGAFASKCKEEYLAMSTDDLFAAAQSSERVGGCWISNGGPTAFCDLYVKTATLGTGDRGWPRTPDGRGTGCVKAPEFPKGRSNCFFYSSQYDLTDAERASFCTNNGKENAVAQLKHAIERDQCNIPSCGSNCKEYYLGLSNADLYHAASEQRKVGGCGINTGSSSSACDLYVTTATVDNGYRGWPRTPDGRGTGCVKAPDFPKGVSHCFFYDTQYDLTDAERASFCTDNGKDNAVAQLRHAIEHDQCEFTSCQPLPSPSPSPSPQVRCPCRCRSFRSARRECRASPFHGNCRLKRCRGRGFRRRFQCC